MSNVDMLPPDEPEEFPSEAALAERAAEEDEQCEHEWELVEICARCGVSGTVREWTP